MVVDFDELSGAVERFVIDRLDHTSLNDTIPNPTAELIALWIWDELAPHLPSLDEVVVWETTSACAIVRDEDARDR